MPQLKLTQANLDALPPPGDSPVEYTDTELTGFMLRRGRRGMTFYVRAYDPATRRRARIKLGTDRQISVSKARKLAQDRLADARVAVSSGETITKDRRDDRPTDITLKQSLEQMLRERQHRLSEKTRRSYEAVIENHMSDWLNLPITKITPTMVIERHAKISAMRGGDGHLGGKVAANTACDVLRTIINYISNRYVDSLGQPMILYNPTNSLKALKLRNPVKRRKTIVKRSDLNRWLADICNYPNEHRRDLALFVWQTGARPGEPEQLEWPQVDFEERSFTFEKTKNGDELHLPMSDFLYALFAHRWEHYGRHGARYVFGWKKDEPIGDIKHVLKVLQRGNQVRFTFQDMRRGFVTACEACQIGFLTYKRLVNHRIDHSDVTAGYFVGEVETLRGPSQSISNYQLQVANAVLAPCDDPPAGALVIDFEDRMLTTSQAAQASGMTKAWFEGQRHTNKDGGPPFYKVARDIAYRESELKAWFEAQGRVYGQRARKPRLSERRRKELIRAIMR